MEDGRSNLAAIRSTLMPVSGTCQIRRRLALVLPLVVLAACATAPPSMPVGSSIPTATVPTPSPSATPNRPAHAGSPAIEEPYWLLFTGTSVSTVTDKEKNVIETTNGESYQVLRGGSLEGTILIDGEQVGFLEVNATEGGAIPGLDPIEQQYGAQIDDVLPTAGVLTRSPNPYWTRTTQDRGALRVFVREPASPTVDVELASDAFWWDPAHETWYQLSSATDLDAVLTALLGPAR